MSENLVITAIGKEEKYKELYPQLKALIGDETDLIANMANICAALKFGMGFFWVGFYLVKHNQLVLGPFQGPVACTRIDKGKGVCGTSWQREEILIVEDVESFPGHIACNALSKSEIVIPVFDAEKKMVALLDIDSTELKDFDTCDSEHLSSIVSLLHLS
jgi:L-methionine (R)-S-oxide reductase